jgi:excisionase family DNA binding protein
MADLWRPEKAAEVLGISRLTLLAWARAGKIASVKPSPRLVLFRPEDVQEFIEKSERPALAAAGEATS